MKISEITVESVKHDAQFAVLNALHARFINNRHDEVEVSDIEYMLNHFEQSNVSSSQDIIRLAKFAFSNDDLSYIARRVAPQLSAMLIPAELVD